MNKLKEQIEQELNFNTITAICEHLTDAVQEMLDSCGMYFRIFSRVKSVDSIAEKIERGRYGTEYNPKKIQDLVGLRVVLYYYDDLSICRDIMESTFQMIDDWSRPKYNADEFRATKINGVFRFPSEYFSLYKSPLWTLPIDTTFEIQFRTVFFEGWHEIEHDMRYKSILSDRDFWQGSEELSRILNCILANLELSDWSLVQLFEELSYNHYKLANWEMMLKSKYRIKMQPNETLDPRIIAVFDRDREIAKPFFKASRKTLIKELLKLDHPHLSYDLIIRLMNDRVVHNEELAAICEEVSLSSIERSYQKSTLARLESNVLFHLELPLLHKETRSFQSEFHNAAAILYKWARFKLNPVFEYIPAELSNYDAILPGYQLKTSYDCENLSFSMKLQYIDSETPGTLWHVHSSLEYLEDGQLHFYHMTSRDMPKSVTQKTTFLKPSFLHDLSKRIGIMDVVRIGSKVSYVRNQKELEQLACLIRHSKRKLPVVAIIQNTGKPSDGRSQEKYGEYDMTTFTINGTRLSKVVGHYCHVYMVDYEMAEAFASVFDLPAPDTIGSICVYWPKATRKEMDFFTRKMVIDTQFDFNKLAFHDDNIYEKAFRHKLVQMMKQFNVM
ncbi:MAG: hypothetical protein LUH14_12685 [Clostridiaceae bacterium]|nr:hypothetical protein [Clostridiaceae bacterium]